MALFGESMNIIRTGVFLIVFFVVVLALFYPLETVLPVVFHDFIPDFLRSTSILMLLQSVDFFQMFLAVLGVAVIVIMIQIARR